MKRKKLSISRRTPHYVHRPLRRHIAPEEKMRLDEISVISEKLIGNIENVIVGKRSAIESSLVAFFCRGHLLIEDAPGLGKTMLARSIAGSVNADFKRIQGTPDLLPADIIGVSIYNSDTHKFEFRKGPVFSQDRPCGRDKPRTPKTQSALLEAMGESQVSVEGTTIQLPAPFFVAATQNPIEFEGTFPLPEAQMDRFMASISIGYPSQEDEGSIIEMQNRASDFFPETRDGHGHGDRDSEPDTYGTRGPIPTRLHGTHHGSDAHRPGRHAGFVSARKHFPVQRVAGQGRHAGARLVVPEDIKSLAGDILRHRLIIRPESRLRNIRPDTVISRILTSIPVPLEDLSRTGAGEQ